MIREILQEELKKQGISATKLAEKAGIRQASVTEFLSGNRNLRSDNIDKLFEALNINKPDLQTLVDSFVKGSKAQIYELMLLECARVEDVIENRIVSKLEMASYMLGVFAADIYLSGPPSIRAGYYEKIVVMGKQGPLFDETIRLKFSQYVRYLGAKEKELLPILFMEYTNLPSKEAEIVPFMAAFFRNIL